MIFLSTPSARRATVLGSVLVVAVIISIHALREEGDRGVGFSCVPLPHISIHALREEGDLHRALPDTMPGAFLSTPSARRATELSVILGDVMLEFLSTPSARRATRHPVGVRPTGTYFYPRPPRGGRPFVTNETISIIEFLSTPSARRATVFSDSQRTVNIISIHALREEGDAWWRSSTRSAKYFYPRPPRGGRLNQTLQAQKELDISIHALREEGDC